MLLPKEGKTSCDSPHLDARAVKKRLVLSLAALRWMDG